MIKGKYQVYFALSVKDRLSLSRYVIQHSVMNTSGKLLSVNEACFCIVKNWLDDYEIHPGTTAIEVTSNGI